MNDDPRFTPTAAFRDQPAASWTLLAQQVDQFVAAWEQASAGTAASPEIAEFLPNALDPWLQEEILIELIKVDLEHRWALDRLPRKLEDYFAEWPALKKLNRADLLYEEFGHRRRAGDDVDPAEYRERFPQCASDFEQLCQLEGPPRAEASTSKSRMRRALERIQPGDSLDDFDMLTELGAGAFARVFLARQRSMQRLVAVKLSADRGAEPQMLAQLDHEHIVRVFDQRRLPEQGLRLMYMQYLPGGTLHPLPGLVRGTAPQQRTGELLVQAVRQSLESRGEGDRLSAAWAREARRQPWPAAVIELGRQLAEALDYSHRQGVLHRDLKPANVLLTGDGAAKLADFNIGCAANVAGAAPAAYFGGSLAYMSPEQLEVCRPGCNRRPQDLDGRSDLYALGVLLCELLCGSRPFPDPPPGGSWIEVLDGMIALRRRGVDDDLRRQLDEHGCPRPLRQVLDHCLQADERLRPATGGRLAQSLELCQSPRAAELLMGVDQGWRAAVLRAPVATTVATALAPNIAAAAFNLAYNKAEIIDHLPGAEAAFWRIQGVINALSFPAGVAWVLSRVWPVFTAVRKGAPEGADVDVRRQALLLGVSVGGASLLLWSLAGLAYPLALRQFAGHLPWSVHLHFFASLALCGLVAGVYPLLMVTWLAVKAFYPRLAPPTAPVVADDAEALDGARYWCEAALWLAAAVPMLAVVLLVATGSNARAALLVAALTGLLGFGGAFLGVRELRDDLSTLAAIVRRSAKRDGGASSSATGSSTGSAPR